jgi:hypothetical protein
MTPLALMFGFYLLAIILGKLTVRPGYRAIIVVALLTITEVGLVLLYLYNVSPPKVD